MTEKGYKEASAPTKYDSIEEVHDFAKDSFAKPAGNWSGNSKSAFNMEAALAVANELDELHRADPAKKGKTRAEHKVKLATQGKGSSETVEQSHSQGLHSPDPSNWKGKQKEEQRSEEEDDDDDQPRPPTRRSGRKHQSTSEPEGDGSEGSGARISNTKVFGQTSESHARGNVAGSVQNASARDKISKTALSRSTSPTPTHQGPKTKPALQAANPQVQAMQPLQSSSSSFQKAAAPKATPAPNQGPSQTAVRPLVAPVQPTSAPPYTGMSNDATVNTTLKTVVNSKKCQPPKGAKSVMPFTLGPPGVSTTSQPVNSVSFGSKGSTYPSPSTTNMNVPLTVTPTSNMSISISQSSTTAPSSSAPPVPVPTTATAATSGPTAATFRASAMGTIPAAPVAISAISVPAPLPPPASTQPTLIPAISRTTTEAPASSTATVLPAAATSARAPVSVGDGMGTSRWASAPATNGVIASIAAGPGSMTRLQPAIAAPTIPGLAPPPLAAMTAPAPASAPVTVASSLTAPVAQAVLLRDIEMEEDEVPVANVEMQIIKPIPDSVNDEVDTNYEMTEPKDRDIQLENLANTSTDS